MKASLCTCLRLPFQVKVFGVSLWVAETTLRTVWTRDSSVRTRAHRGRLGGGGFLALDEVRKGSLLPSPVVQRRHLRQSRDHKNAYCQAALSCSHLAMYGACFHLGAQATGMLLKRRLKVPSPHSIVPFLPIVPQRSPLWLHLMDESA